MAQINGHEYVDLGLPSGTLWATCNVGADTPEETGNYYAWGETETKTDYNHNSYKHSGSFWFTMKKYCQKRLYGRVDKKTTLQLNDDIVRTLNPLANIPSTHDFEELLQYCTWKYEDGCYICKSKINENIITFPVTGNMIDKQLYSPNKGYYWTSDLNSINCYANIFFFNDNNPVKIRSLTRAYGACIKPVIYKDMYVPEDPEPVLPPVEPDKPEIPDNPNPEEPELPDTPGTSTDVEEIPETGEIAEHQIGTYNIRYWNGEDDPNNQGDIAWPNRKENITEFLSGRYGFAIFGLQEITSQMYSGLQIPDSTYYGYGRDNGQLNESATGEQIGIFANTDAFQILQHGSFFYNTKEKSSFNRLCVWALVQSTVNGKKFYIFNNHLAHDSATVRKQQVETLLRKIEEIAGDNIVFIIGDFNLVNTEESYSLITAKYNDAYKLTENPQGGYNGTNHTYTGLYSTTDTTSKRVDYIFTNLDTVEFYIADNDNMGLEKYPSDHLPVVATFKF